MKQDAIRALSLLFALSSAFSSQGQSVTSILERGRNHRVVQIVSEEAGPGGQLVSLTNRYTELATGMHYEQDGQFVVAGEVIEPLGNVAVGRSAGSKVIFSANINNEHAIDFLSPAGERFRSRVVGLSFYDEESDSVVFIADVKDSVGEVLPPNQIIYRDAFDGVKADIRYTYLRSGLTQDILIRAALPFVPEDFGFSSIHARLEVTSEFAEAHEPGKTVRTVDGMTDQTLRFTDLCVGPGRAFSLGAEMASVPVSKEWQIFDGRQFLVEAVAYQSVRNDIEALPAAEVQAAVQKPNVQLIAGGKRSVPRLQPSTLGEAEVLVATVSPEPKAFVLDYTILADGDELILRGDETYYVSSDVFVTNLVIMGGCVVKFANSASLEVSADGSVETKTRPYLPAIFTARDDHNVGYKIGTNDLAGYYADTALKLHGDAVLNYLRISHAQNAIGVDDGVLTVNHCQITACETGIEISGADVYANNVLVHSVSNVVLGSVSPGFFGQHLTVHDAIDFINSSSSGSAGLTNSLLVNVDGWGDIVPATNKVESVKTNSVFQIVGAGGHYLAQNSPYRNMGTTNITTELAADLRMKTTYPPVLLDGAVTLDTILRPQAMRDLGGIDLGYHYTPLDYLLDTVVVTNATVRIAEGSALATYSTTGFWCQDNSTLLSEGSATKPNVLTRYYAVQEVSQDRGALAALAVTTYGNPLTTVRLRFTQSTIPSSGGQHFYAWDEVGWTLQTLELTDCSFYGGTLYLDEGSSAIHAITNCLFDTVYFSAGVLDTRPYHMYNNLFLDGSGWFWPDTNIWYFMDNALDYSGLEDYSGLLQHDYNAFHQSSNFHQYFSPSANELLLSSLTYDQGALGDYYQPGASSLIDAGSLTNAALAGLYHYTTGTNQVKEMTNRVDIGIHYIAVDGDGLPLDTDGDGVPDYLEDANGNGVHDTGETDWEVYDSPNGIASGPGLVVFTPFD